MLYENKVIVREVPEEKFKFKNLELVWPKETFRKVLNLIVQFAKVLLNGEFSRDKKSQKFFTVSSIEEIDGKPVLKYGNKFRPDSVTVREDGYFYLQLKNGEVRSLKTITELLEDTASLERETVKDLEKKVEDELERRRLLEWRCKLSKCHFAGGPVKCEDCHFYRIYRGGCSLETIANAVESVEHEKKSAEPLIQKALAKLSLPDKVKKALSQCRSWSEFKSAIRAIRTGMFAVVTFNVRTAKCYVASDKMIINPDKNFYPDRKEDFRKYTGCNHLAELPEFIIPVLTRENRSRKQKRATKIFFGTYECDSSD